VARPEGRSVSAPQKYKVTAVTDRREWTPKGETAVKRVYYDLTLEGVGQANLGLPPTDPEPQVGQEIFAILKDSEDGKPPTLVIPNSKGGGGYKGKTPEERAQDRANSAVIRTYEYYLIPPDQRPTLRDYLEAAAKVHTALTRIEAGKAVVEP
jgi:hypothetical protein